MFIKVKVFPGSKENKIIEKKSDAFDIFVKEKPREGKANRAVMDSLSFYLKIPSGKLKLVKGVNQKSKIFNVSQ